MTLRLQRVRFLSGPMRLPLAFMPQLARLPTPGALAGKARLLASSSETAASATATSNSPATTEAAGSTAPPSAPQEQPRQQSPPPQARSQGPRRATVTGRGGSARGAVAGDPGDAGGLSVPARVNHAYFTGNPKYYNLTQRLNELIRRHGKRPEGGPTPRVARTMPRWMSMQELAVEKQMKLTVGTYRGLVRKLGILHGVADKDPQVRQLLLRFEANKGRAGVVRQRTTGLDAYGRSQTRGSRKTARAHCWIVAGDGHVVVNGAALADRFARFEDRECAVAPLEAAARLGKYNVWAVVAGGGPAAQAEALSVAIARGLVVHERQLAPVLEPFATIDTRQVERKKTGQPGARKKKS
ncbi:37S ribosomal protein S9, mitochondrial, partial [Cladochytrium tenue]